MVFHVLNRANARAQIFAKDADYAAFERVLQETLAKSPMRILGYLIMPNYWHLALWPEHDGDLGAFMQRLTMTHVRRWHLHRKTVGCGHLYQGTYKSFPVETDEHLLTVLCYVERNALRAGLVQCAEDWRWSSLWRWRNAGVTEDVPPLTAWPVERPRQLFAPSEPIASEIGGGSDPNLPPMWPPLRQRHLAGHDCGEAWARIYLSTPR